MYCAFQCANPLMVKEMPLKDFTNYYLDNMNLKDLLEQLQALVHGIMGEDPEAPAEQSERNVAAEENENAVGN
ncbi:MAG: hypothetical protein ACI4T5_10500 [Prevotella sp.]